jgi:thymidylate kinase
LNGVTDAPSLFVITGAPGAGKTTIAGHLMQRFQFGLHIPIDNLREWVVSGIAHPLPTWTDETTRQFTLARQGAADLSKRYLDAGFAVAVDDIIGFEDVHSIFIDALRPRAVHPILLFPSLKEALARNAGRTTKTFDTSVLVSSIEMLHEQFEEQVGEYPGWIVLDTDGLSVEATVDQILERTGRATSDGSATRHGR